MASSVAGAAEYVLDSYALLAYLQGAPGGVRVGELLQAAAGGGCRLFMSVVNLGEVLYIVERARGLASAQEALARIDELPIAYADGFAAALARLRNAPLVTGDPEFRHLRTEEGVPIEWLVG